MKKSLYIFLLLFFVTNVTVLAEPQNKVDICDICHKPKSLCDGHRTPPKPPKAPKEFTCKFSCEPKSATLYIDGHKMGSAYGDYKLKKGKHLVKLVANGYQDFEKRIHVSKGKTSFSYEMKAKIFDVRMGSNANRAALYCDGKYIGMTPCSLNLKAGRHRVELSADGYDNYNESIHVSESKTSFNFVLVPKNQQKQDKPQEQKEFDVRFSCNDPDAAIIIDDNHSIKANETIKLTSGNHDVQIISSSYIDSTAIVKVDKDHTNFGFDLAMIEQAQLEPANESKTNETLSSVQREFENPQRLLTQQTSSETNPPKETNKFKDWFRNIDWELESDYSFSVGYSYCFHFPIGGMLSFTKSHFLFALEGGLELSDKTKLPKNNDENVEVAPHWTFVIGSPGYYYKYFSVQCGFGIMRKSNTFPTITDVYIDNNNISIEKTDLNKNLNKTYFCWKPSLTGYFPVSDEHCISISVGYLFIHDCKRLNGISCGIGFQWLFD